MNHTAIELALYHEEYRPMLEGVPWLRTRLMAVEINSEPYRRFLMRVISRAVLDFCMYEKGTTKHDSAREWLTSGRDGTFGSLCDLLDLDWMVEPVQELIEDPCSPYRDKVHKMRKLLYGLKESASN